MRGDLTARFEKGGKTMTRTLEDDRSYIAPDGSSFTLPGRSLMFIRNVGHLMTTPAVRLSDGSEAQEGILDAIFTSRSEEHTSELRSLMRISYAVFCLTKKKKQKNTNREHAHCKNRRTS